jgi:hypothetical protein
VEHAQFLRIRDRFDGIAEAVRDPAKAKIERIEDGLATGGEAAFLAAFEFAGFEAFLNPILTAFHSAFLAEFLGEGHGCSAVRFRTNRVYLMEEGIIVNGVAAAHVPDGKVEGVEKNHSEEFVVPDRVAEELAGAFGLEDTEDEDAIGSAADGVKRDGCKLDEFVEEIGHVPAHRIVCPGEAEEQGKARINVPDAAVLCDDDGDNLWIGRAVVRVLLPAVPDAGLVAEEAHGEAGIAGGLMFKENIDSDIAAVGLGRKEEVGFGEAKVRVDERAGFEFKRAPVDARGDFRGKSVDEEGRRRSGIRKAGPEESVVGMKGILVSHGSPKMIDSRDAGASRDAP